MAIQPYSTYIYIKTSTFITPWALQSAIQLPRDQIYASRISTSLIPPHRSFYIQQYVAFSIRNILHIHSQTRGPAEKVTLPQHERGSKRPPLRPVTHTSVTAQINNPAGLAGTALHTVTRQGRRSPSPRGPADLFREENSAWSVRVTGSCGPQADLPCSRERGRERESPGKDSPLGSRVSASSPCATISTWPQPGVRVQGRGEVPVGGPRDKCGDTREADAGHSERSTVLLPLLDSECVVKE